MRYFLQLAYNGTNYSGWQRQPNNPTIQQVLEEGFSLILRAKIEITGCGRTDAGVHASRFIAHFDFAGEFPPAFNNRINRFLPKDIAIHKIFPVAEDVHARYDARKRSYEYHVVFEKNPFLTNTAYSINYGKKLDFDKLQEAAKLLLNYTDFFTFCKTNHDAKTTICDLMRSEWIQEDDGKRWVFYISANRFLRGMVRLIVGMCLNVAEGRLELETVRDAMENQLQLQKAESAPAHGLFLTEIVYPFL